MRAEIYWIAGVTPGRIAVLPRPRGGDWLEDEIKELRQAGVDVLVCLLTHEEMSELDIEAEPGCCSAVGVEFISFPINDRCVPTSEQETVALVRRLAGQVLDGRAVAIHCRQGVGRSALLAACVLAALGEKPEVAFERVGRARGCAVPDTPEQKEWVVRFAGRHM